MKNGIAVVTLVSLSDGAALELFQAGWDKVLENVADPNTNWKTKRKVTLDIEVTPNEDRTASVITIKCGTKLAGLNAHETYVYIGRDNGQLVAIENNPQQQMLFDKRGGIQPTAINGGKAEKA